MQGYIKIDKYIHQHCQTIAKFGRSFAESKEDDSHTNLSLDEIGKTIWGRWVNVNNKKYMLGLDLPTQKFNLVDKNKSLVVSFEMKGKKQSDVESDLASYFNDKLSLDGEDFLKPLHYEIPAYDFVDEEIPKYHVDQMDVWFQYRSLAKKTCLLLTDHLQTAAEIRIWPHHFDTGIYIEYDKQIGIGFGWAMADSMMSEAYFYYSVYGVNGFKVNYDNPIKLSVGKWIINENWKGAVLSLSQATESNAATFLRESTSWALEKQSS